MDKSLPRLWIRVELKIFMAGGQKHNICKDYKRFSVASSLRRIALEYHNGVGDCTHRYVHASVFMYASVFVVALILDPLIVEFIKF